MEMVKLRINKKMKEVALDRGMNYKGENYKAVEENGQVTVEIPKDHACNLLGNDYNGFFDLLVPNELRIMQNKLRGSQMTTIKSLSQKTVEPKAPEAPKAPASGPEDAAIALLNSIEEKYHNLGWDLDKFKNFCEVNEIAVTGTWGIKRIIKELVEMDSELQFSAAAFEEQSSQDPNAPQEEG